VSATNSPVADGALLAKYVEAAIAHGSASERSDYRNANRQNDLCLTLSSELRERAALHLLLPLLSHPHPWVRFWSSAACLEFAPHEARPVLEALVESPHSPMLALDAQLVIDEWKKGSFPANDVL
jgi:hypothetical protein